MSCGLPRQRTKMCSNCQVPSYTNKANISRMHFFCTCSSSRTMRGMEIILPQYALCMFNGLYSFVHLRVPRSGHTDGNFLASLDFACRQDAICNDDSDILQMAVWFDGDNVVSRRQPIFFHCLSHFTLISQ